MHVKLWKCFKCFSFSSFSLPHSLCLSLSLSFALQSVSWPAAVKNRLVLLTRAANIQLSWTAVGYWRHIKNHLNRRGKLFPENGLSHKQQVKTAIWMLQSCVWKIITKGFGGIEPNLPMKFDMQNIWNMNKPTMESDIDFHAIFFYLISKICTILSRIPLLIMLPCSILEENAFEMPAQVDRKLGAQ